jgi:hypothetical protein
MRLCSRLLAGAILACAIGLPLSHLAAQEMAGRLADEIGAPTWLPVSITLALVVVAASGVLVYPGRLQKRFLAACQENRDIALFAQHPAGVPEGTIRSLLALFIVFASIAFVALAMLPLPGIKEFPELLSGILGSVLGFYFGARGPGLKGAGEVLQRVDAAQAERDRALDETKAGKVEQIRDQVASGVGVARAVAKVLPAEVGKQIDRVADTIDQGLVVVDRLRSAGSTEKALEQAVKLASELGQKDPVKSTLLQAASSFAGVLGGSLPPLVIASAVVAIGSRLAGAAYDRWVARVLHAPYTPELFPPTVIDASTAMTITLQSPVLKRAFAPELEQGERRFFSELVDLVLSEARIEELWQRLGPRFADRADFDEGIALFQRGAMTLETVKDLPADLAREAGGIDPLLAAVDRLYADPQARRDLDAIVLMADALKRDGRDPAAAFAEARRQLERKS